MDHRKLRHRDYARLIFEHRLRHPDPPRVEVGLRVRRCAGDDPVEVVRKTLRLFLKYTPDKRSVITDLKRVSKPGSRRYKGSSEIRPVVGGMGISIMTTPKGVMTGRAARKAHIGGEVLCEVW